MTHGADQHQTTTNGRLRPSVFARIATIPASVLISRAPNSAGARTITSHDSRVIATRPIVDQATPPGHVSDHSVGARRAARM